MSSSECQDPVRIILTMIVRNEQATLQRCFDACRPIVDAAVICDTGSTDSTPEIIERFLQQIPGTMHRHVWRNFGHNRTLSATVAKDFCDTMSWSPSRTYFLFVDADMVLVAKPDFDKQSLSKKGYLINQSHGGTIYANLRLGRADNRWTSVGVTHEYWSPHHDDPAIHNEQNTLLKSLEIDDRNDGGFKADKFPRDAALLERGLQEEPNNVRYMFYLAQTYRDIAGTSPETEKEKRAEFNQRAIDLYQRRIDAGGWDEEIYFSKFQIGVLQERLGRINEAIQTYLMAYDYRPSRCEALTAASTLARHHSKNTLSTMFAKQALEVAATGDMLFVDRDAWRVNPLYNLSICAYYTPEKPLGLCAIERLLSDRSVDTRYRDSSISNLFFYLPSIAAVLRANLSVTTLTAPPTISDNMVRRMSPSNPSLCLMSNGKLMLNVRHVNYRIRPPLCYEFPFEEDQGRVLTRNVLGEIDGQTLQWKNEETVAVVDDRSSAFYALNVERIQGCEDMRLIEFNQSLWCTFTSLEAVPGQVRIVLGKFNATMDALERMVLLQGEGIGSVEKNWLTFVVGDELRFIHRTDPLTVYRIDVETGLCTKLFERSLPIRLDFTRGSSPLIRLEEDNSWLYLTHEVIPRDGGRVYAHRFVQLDRDLNLMGRSLPFYFENKQVEFACGAARVGSDLLVSYGVWDRQARIMRVPLVKVLESIRDVDTF